MSENIEGDLKFAVQEPVTILGQPGRNILHIRFRLTPGSSSGHQPSESHIRLAMTAETASLLLAGLRGAEMQFDMPVAQVEVTNVPRAKDRN